MEKIYYYSRNAKKAPFRVTIKIDGETVYIDCDCPLGHERKICRHKINAIRGDKSKADSDTEENTINTLRKIFPRQSTLRQHLEEGWRAIREYSYKQPDDEEGVQEKRKQLGEALSSGFYNEVIYPQRQQADPHEILSAAIGTGEVFNIMYYGKGRPGTWMEIVPLAISGCQLRAFCSHTGAEKSLDLGAVTLLPQKME